MGGILRIVGFQSSPAPLRINELSRSYGRRPFEPIKLVAGSHFLNILFIPVGVTKIEWRTVTYQIEHDRTILSWLC